MPVATDTSRTGRWLRSRLSALDLPIYRGAAPEDAPFPCIVFRRLGGADITAIRSTVAVRSVWLVFVVGKTSSEAESQRDVNALEPHADAMHDAIQYPGITAQNGRLIHECSRESEHEASLVENGTEYLQIGGVYRIWSTAA